VEPFRATSAASNILTSQCPSIPLCKVTIQALSRICARHICPTSTMPTLCHPSSRAPRGTNRPIATPPLPSDRISPAPAPPPAALLGRTEGVRGSVALMLILRGHRLALFPLLAPLLINAQGLSCRTMRRSESDSPHPTPPHIAASCHVLQPSFAAPSTSAGVRRAGGRAGGT
jgi:hypothetical protein